jgi:DNA-binding IclR family transcriptional regulator
MSVMTQPKCHPSSERERLRRERANRQPAKPFPERYLAPSEIFIHNPRLSLALQCGLAIQQYVAAAREPVSLSRISRDMRLTPSTAHRYAVTLAALGFLQQDQSRRYYVSHAAGRLGANVLGSVLLHTKADDVLRRLRERTGFTVGLAVLDARRATYVRRYHAHGHGQYGADAEIRSGAHVALHNSAIGKALLASIPRAEAAKVLEDIASSDAQVTDIFNARQLDAEIAEVAITGAAVSNGSEPSQARAVAMFVPRQIEELPLAVDVTAPASSVSMKSFEESIVPPLASAIAHITNALADVPRDVAPDFLVDNNAAQSSERGPCTRRGLDEA